MEGGSKKQKLARKTVDEKQAREAVKNLGAFVATNLQFKLRNASWPGSLS